MKKAKPMAPSNMSIQTTGATSYMDRPSMKQDDHPDHNMPESDYKGFESTMQVGDYEMPRAGKTSDYFTEADKKANPGVR